MDPITMLLMSLLPDQTTPSGRFEPTDQARGINIFQDQVGSLFDPQMAAMFALLGGGGYDFTRLVPDASAEDEDIPLSTPLFDRYSRSQDPRIGIITADIQAGLTPIEIAEKLAQSPDTPPGSDAYKTYTQLASQLFDEQVKASSDRQSKLEQRAAQQKEPQLNSQQKMFLDAGLPDPLRTFTPDDFVDSERMSRIADLRAKEDSLRQAAVDRSRASTARTAEQWKQRSIPMPKPPMAASAPTAGRSGSWSSSSLPNPAPQSPPQLTNYQGPTNFGEVTRLAERSRGREMKDLKLDQATREADYEERFAAAKAKAKADLLGGMGFSPATLALAQRMSALRQGGFGF